MNVKGELKDEDGVYSCSFNCVGSCLDVVIISALMFPILDLDGDCDLLPNRVKTCYCGKTRLEEQIRGSCLDPIPSCSNTCRKLLPCGLHTCNEVCHAGDCPPCLVQVNQKCRCGSTSRTAECYMTTSSEREKFVCAKPCGRKKNCGRHRCSERCCPLLNAKKNDQSGDWDPHVCQLHQLHSLFYHSNLILDMNFTVEIARFAGYPFKVVQNHASVVINRGMNIFSSRGISPQSKLPKTEWFTEAAKSAINRLLMGSEDASEPEEYDCEEDGHIVLPEISDDEHSDSLETSSLSTMDTFESFASARMADLESPSFTDSES